MYCLDDIEFQLMSDKFQCHLNIDLISPINNLYCLKVVKRSRKVIKMVFRDHVCNTLNEDKYFTVTVFVQSLFKVRAVDKAQLLLFE